MTRRMAKQLGVSEQNMYYMLNYSSASASYIDDMNTHILEFIIRQFMEKRKNNPSINKLSDLLDS